ncbi:MAG: NfeD family protein [Bacilli bacterium]|jgi:membrane protein implicated in regulation of membrane protease activity|nr:NfeD family protein [Bacilli bacterium]
MPSLTEIMLYIWLAVFVLSFIAEAVSFSLVSVWFCIGALISILLNLIPGMPYWVEIIVFFVVSGCCLALLRPIAQRQMQRRISKSNIDEIVGQTGVVIKTITLTESGEVKIGDVIWTGISSDPEKDIPEKTIIEVVAVKGNKLIVKPKELKKEDSLSDKIVYRKVK